MNPDRPTRACGPVLVVCPGPATGRWRPYFRELHQLLSDRFLLVTSRSHEPAGRGLKGCTETVSALPLGDIFGHNGLELWAPKQLYDKIVNFGPDVVHVMGEPSYFLSYLTSSVLREATEGDFVVTCRAAQNIYQKWPPPIAWWERPSIAEMDGIFYLSRGARKVLLQKGRDDGLFYLPNGYDSKVFGGSVSKSAERITFGFVGHLNYRKGVDLLVKALLSLSDIPCWRALVVGDGAMEEWMKAKLSGNDLGGRVTFTGRVGSTELRDLYDEMDILVLPSRQTDGRQYSLGKLSSYLAVQWQEQFGQVIVEAKAHGVPTLGSNSGAIPEVIGDGGWTFSENDSVELREKMSDLLTNRGELVRRSHIAKQEADQFEWNAVARQTIKYWDRLL